MIVVDTNIISYFYITSNQSILAERLFTANSHWNAPALWKSEFRNVLSFYLRKGFLKLEEVLIILQQAEKLMQNNEYEVSSSHVMQLVNSSNCSSYDCEFVALAQHLDAPLVTADKKILREFPEYATSLDSYFA
jgi:predicted nucleic acid-binding protein